jgi:branched-chain amino acid aminotransferase
MGILTVERTVKRTELYTADELFFSGTGVQVAWISAVDGRAVGNGKQGPFTQKLQNLFFNVVKGNAQKYRAWNTKITYSSYEKK